MREAVAGIQIRVLWRFAAVSSHVACLVYGSCNLAGNKTVTQSSTEWFTYGGASHWGAAEFAVDGNVEVEFGVSTCIRAGWDWHPWWMVDMAALYVIEEVAVVTRNWGYYLLNFTIETATSLSGDGPASLLDPSLCFYENNVLARGVTVIYPCLTRVAARYVKITRWHYNKPVVMAFCEIIVYGTQVDYVAALPVVRSTMSAYGYHLHTKTYNIRLSIKNLTEKIYI